jgi:hypothetical protein
MRRPALALVGSVVIVSAGCSSRGVPSTQTSATPSSSASAKIQIPSVRAALPGIEHFVERERGLQFKHPVKAKLLRGKAFVAKLDKGQSTPKPKAVERLISTFSALGLVSPRTDIVKAFRTATDDGTLGFYDFKSKHLYVRGSRATPGVRAVLSHELTHALTDQWFGLRRPKLDKSRQELSLGFTALIEGDAERTRKAYESEVLSPAERTLAEHEEAGTGSMPHVPQIVLQLIGFPYEIGPDFVQTVVTRGGLKALNAAYRHPPTSSEQLIYPVSYFAHDDPKHVATPTADGVRVDHGDLGVVGFLLMLEHGLSASDAQQALIGWGGDHYVTWRAGQHRWCLRDSAVMDNSAAQVAFDSALADWASQRGSRANIEQQGTTTTFVTCSS